MEPTPSVDLFARKIAHDLNNFATVIRTYSELLLGDLPAESAAHADVSEIHRAADAMVSYVQRTARFARAGSMRARPTDPDVILQDVLGTQPVSDGQAAVRFDLTQGERVDSMETDAGWLADTVRELLVNAREAAPPDSAVDLTRTARLLTAPLETSGGVLAAGRYLIVSVSDSGPGFAESVEGNAEEPFVTTKHGVRGAGFGLSIARAYARASGGVLTRDRHADRTNVSLWLPAS
jgi:signal transduction histidine kinase